MALGETSTAERDFEQSLRLLPTAIAYNELGKLAEARGDADRALAYYERAQGSESSAGRDAARRALLIDLPRRPQRYIGVDVATEQDRPVVVIENRTQATIVNIVVRVDMGWSDGSRTSTDIRVSRLDAVSRSLRALPERRGLTLSGARAQIVSAGIAGVGS